MSQKFLWGQPFTTTGWQNYPNGFVYTQGIPMPTARTGVQGNNPIRVHSFGDYYVTGSGSFMRMNYFSNLVDNGQTRVFGSSGGSFQWEAHQGNISNQMFFGRDQPAGRTVVSNNDGFVWAGTLAGSLYWDQVPGQLSALNTSVSGRNIRVWLGAPSDNGGTAVDNYAIDISTNDFASLTTVYSSDHTFTSLTPGVNYRFRAHAHNAVGWGVTRSTGNIQVSGAGRRYTGSAWQSTTIAKRYTGSAFTDLTIARRYTGSAWTDLTN